MVTLHVTRKNGFVSLERDFGDKCAALRQTEGRKNSSYNQSSMILCAKYEQTFSPRVTSTVT